MIKNTDKFEKTKLIIEIEEGAGSSRICKRKGENENE